MKVNKLSLQLSHLCKLSVEAQVYWYFTTELWSFQTNTEWMEKILIGENWMEKILSEEEKQRINVLLERHQPKEETKERERIVLSEKGRKISIKTEVASSSMKPFEEWPVEHEEASKRKYEVIGTDIETEYEDMDTE